MRYSLSIGLSWFNVVNLTFSVSPETEVICRIYLATWNELSCSHFVYDSQIFVRRVTHGTILLYWRFKLSWSSIPWQRSSNFTKSFLGLGRPVDFWLKVEPVASNFLLHEQNLFNGMPIKVKKLESAWNKRVTTVFVKKFPVKRLKWISKQWWF